ncbi:hypothetical protein FEM48_Zijuj09G0069600 [Ziziphus jujuba var. spinosa]|uniref:Uncharacterized protein n=1 Tax=Ziziphus jujuba var. spinosa TaxID=714518 RepID=A0A978URI3_ZIZJJ|nr:hypothetical protein FEM48_Zijuj09G0069600 [Ziziphus jujuba var. spinosa]
MWQNCCHISLAFVPKFLDFLQAFIGVSIVLYSVWMVDQWENLIPISPPPSSPPDFSSLSLFLHSDSDAISDQTTPLNFKVDLVSGFDGAFGLDLHSFKLLAPWFIYSGVGILSCYVTFIGCIAAEATNGCCLCFVSSMHTFLNYCVLKQ